MANNNTDIIMDFSEVQHNVELVANEMARKRALISKLIETVNDNADPEEEIGIIIDGICAAGKTELKRLSEKVISLCNSKL